jgi:hypothetical protein
MLCLSHAAACPCEQQALQDTVAAVAAVAVLTRYAACKERRRLFPLERCTECMASLLVSATRSPTGKQMT